MGLDMHVFKVSKCSEEEAKTLNGKVLGRDIAMQFKVFPTEQGREPYDEIKQILPWLKKTAMKVPCCDYEKMIADNMENPELYDICLYMESQDRCGFVIYPKKEENGLEKREIVLSRGEIEKNYLKLVDIDVYVCKPLEPVAYWRKEYDLSDAITAAVDGPVENEGYYPLNDKMFEIIKKADNQLDEVSEPVTDDYAYVYYEWY